MSAPILTAKQQEYLEKLIELPLSSILDCGEGEKECRDLGQEIFDHFKNHAANRDSLAGEIALRNIADSLPFTCADGRQRKEYVVRAWEGVGDSNCHWMFF